MSEPVHPGFTIMPHLEQRYKDGVQYGTVYALSKGIEAIGAEIHDLLKAPILVDREFIDGLERAIDILKEVK